VPEVPLVNRLASIRLTLPLKSCVDIRRLMEVLSLLLVMARPRSAATGSSHRPDCERILSSSGRSMLEHMSSSARKLPEYLDAKSCHIHLEDATAIACDLTVVVFNPKPEPR
jgi:hypothetical protein